MKKILIITLEFYPQIGGIASYVEGMAGFLKPEQVVVYAPFSQFTKEWDSKQPYKIYRKVQLLPKFFWPRWFRMFWQILKIVKLEKIEMIFVNHALPVGYVAKMINKMKGIPYIVFFHGTDLTNATKNWWKRSRLKSVTETAAQIVFNSEFLKHRALTTYPEWMDKSLVLYPCPEADFSEMPPKEFLEALKNRLALDGKVVGLTVSRFTEGKGLTHVVRLLPKILDKVSNFVWLAIGDGPKKKELFEAVQHGNLQNSVRFVGQVDHEELKLYYYLADLFILLTHPDEGREEAFGLAFLEASAAGIPIIAGRSGGVEESVIDKKTGILVDVHHDQTVLDALDMIFSDQEAADNLVQNGLARIKSELNWSTQLVKLDKWLK